MKKCPYCDFSFPEDKKVCPNCGAPYWKPGNDEEFNEIHKDSGEENRGCLSLLLMPVTVSLGITAFLVLSGFILNLFIHFESNQIKIIWLILSVFGGFLAYKLFKKKRKNKNSQTRSL